MTTEIDQTVEMLRDSVELYARLVAGGHPHTAAVDLVCKACLADDDAAVAAITATATTLHITDTPALNYERWTSAIALVESRLTGDAAFLDTMPPMPPHTLAQMTTLAQLTALILRSTAPGAEQALLDQYRTLVIAEFRP